MSEKKVLSGIQPSGSLHLGNYFGAIRQFINLQEEHEGYYFLADLHALTTVQDPERLRGLVADLATAFLAFGLDPERSVIYRQSDLPEVTEHRRVSLRHRVDHPGAEGAADLEDDVALGHRPVVGGRVPPSQ